MTDPVRVLILEDTASDADLMKDELQHAGMAFTASVVWSRREYLKELDQYSPDIVLSDYHLPQYDGIKALFDLRSRRPDIPFILVTGAIGEDLAIEIFISGANDYVMKNRLQRLAPSVRRALEEAKEIRTRKEAEEALRKAHDDLERQVQRRTAELRTEIEERKKTEASLREALNKIKTLSGLLSICASCKKIRDQNNNWVHIESYIKNHSNADFSHGVCPECALKLYPEVFAGK